MGMGSNAGRDSKFVSIMAGQIVLQVASDTPGAESRINKNEKEVWEIKSDWIEGHITDIKVVDKTDWIEWQVFINDRGEKWILSFPYSGGSATGFLSRIEACDFTKPIRVCPYWIPKEDDPTNHRAYLGLYQDNGDTKIESQYTKENDYNGLPQLKEGKKGRKTTWDDTERQEFFEKLVKEKVLPAIDAAKDSIVVIPPSDIQQEAHQEQEPAVVDESLGVGDENADEFEDDLPF